jgi:hypothetical protein
MRVFFGGGLGATLTHPRHIQRISSRRATENAPAPRRGQTRGPVAARAVINRWLCYPGSRISQQANTDAATSAHHRLARCSPPTSLQLALLASVPLPFVACHHVWDPRRAGLRRQVAGQEGSRPLLLPQASTRPLHWQPFTQFF